MSNYSPQQGYVDYQQPGQQPQYGYYPQEGVPPPNVVYAAPPGAYAPQYQPQQQYYPPQQPQVIVATIAPVSPIVAAPCYNNDDSHVFGAVLLFVLGFFFYIPWVFSFIYCGSRNKTAKGFAIASIVLFFFFLVALIVVLPIIFVVVVASNNRHNDSYYYNY
ncbi:hypothetical protein CYY_000775 [Polysphondylium violaceum]|uniref:Transmembrane protein n=1 Tax=Polysphondylium violaceum TaxID=133409 RepID=A0A8J4V8K1_9MYCE|nr:hypothetical protein CYY_000775 [Polysphondylium violaceum]